MAATRFESTYIYKITSFICLISIVNSSLLVEFTHVSILKGKICKTEDTSFTKTGLDSLLCALLCIVREDCFGTFYSKRESMCVGCCKFYNTSLGLEEFEKDATAHFDFKKSPVCDDVGKQSQASEQETGSEVVATNEDNTNGMTTGNDKTSLEGNANGDAINDISTRAMDNSQENGNGVYKDDITRIGITADTFDTTIHEVDDNSEIPVDITTDEDGNNDGDTTTQRPIYAPTPRP